MIFQKVVWKSVLRNLNEQNYFYRFVFYLSKSVVVVEGVTTCNGEEKKTTYPDIKKHNK